ncbi:unnamed protein product [Closterium sp. NIES-65]|nr:unnamed protein product [Closterium sp. NIES-65]
MSALADARPCLCPHLPLPVLASSRPCLFPSLPIPILASSRPCSVRPSLCPPLLCLPLASSRPCSVRPSLCPPLLCPPLASSRPCSVCPLPLPALALSAPCLFPPLLCPPLASSRPCSVRPLPLPALALSAPCLFPPLLCPPLASSRPCSVRPLPLPALALSTPCLFPPLLCPPLASSRPCSVRPLPLPALALSAPCLFPPLLCPPLASSRPCSVRPLPLPALALSAPCLFPPLLCGRQNALHPGARQAGLLTPGDASYWVSGANFTALEHAAVMMVRPYLLVYGLLRVPNARDGCQMAFADYALPVWQIVPFVLEGEVEAIASGLPQLCRQRSRMHSVITDREQAPLDLYATYDAAIPGGIGPYAYLTRLFGYVSFPVWVHTALALPARGTDHGLIRPQYVRANPSHHGAATFSFIEYEDGTGETVVDRVHLLLTLMMNSEDAHPAGEAVAFVRQWYPSVEDECTGCMRMRPSDDELSYDLVPVASVHRTMHMVESFVTPGLWYLNKWAGRCREELP